MLRVLVLLAVISMGAMLAGCKVNDSNFPETIVTAADLMHHRYEIVTLNGEPVEVAGDLAVEISFGEDMHVSGKACNRFNGKASVENGVLKAPRMASTRMFCGEESLNQLESALFGMLENGARVEIEGEKLILQDDNNTIVYTRRDLVQ